jgi:dihydrodipicolinate synthase/N-acetylneuraminate lyase
MKVTETLNGIIGVVNTPFDDHNQIDSDSLRNYVRQSLRAGVVGFLALGMAAETVKLSTEEKEFVVKTILDEVKGRVPVICSITAKTHKERLSLAQKFIDFGCAGIMVHLLFKDEDLFFRQISAIDELKPGFLMIQDWDFKGSGIPVDVVKKLFIRFRSFKCLKVEVVPAGVKYTSVLDATGGNLHVSGGWAGTQMIEALDRGVHAFMPTIMHDVYVKIYNLHQSGKREQAKALFYELLPILAFSHQHLDISIHFNKKLVHSQGIFSTDKVRDPIIPFDEYHQRVAAELILKAKILSEGILQNESDFKNT